MESSGSLFSNLGRPAEGGSAKAAQPQRAEQAQPSSSSAKELPAAAISSEPAVATYNLTFQYPDLGELLGRHRVAVLPVLAGPAGPRRARPRAEGRPLTPLTPPLAADGRPLPGVPPVVKDTTISLPRGATCLLVGPNGAGKTTLLKARRTPWRWHSPLRSPRPRSPVDRPHPGGRRGRGPSPLPNSARRARALRPPQVLGGKHMVPRDAVRVLGEPPFHAVQLVSGGALSYVGGNWERDVAFAGYSVPLAVRTGPARPCPALPCPFLLPACLPCEGWAGLGWAAGGGGCGSPSVGCSGRTGSPAPHQPGPPPGPPAARRGAHCQPLCRAPLPGAGRHPCVADAVEPARR
jgi:hypothetical protein